MAVTPKIRRSYKGAPVSAVLDSSGVSSATQTAITLTTSPSTWPTGKFFVVVAPGTAQEEKMCVTVSGSTMTVVDPSVTSNSASANGRGVDDTTARSTIAGGATVYPVATARDFDEANQLTATYANQGGIVYLGDPSFTQLAVGTAGQVLKVNSGATAPEWGQVAAAGIASDAVTTAKILDGAVTSAKILDGTIAVGDLATAVANALVPTGTIVAFYGASAPNAGWLVCDGTTFNATTYPALNTLLGGNTLPNLKGKFLVGANASTDFDGLGGDNVNPGDTGGVATVTLTSAQSGVPAHSHPNTATATTTISDATHSHTISIVEGGSHTHTYNIAGQYFTVDPYGTAAVIEGAAGTYSTNSAGTHGHSASSNAVSANITASTSVTMSNQNNTTANASSAHTNVPPYYTVNYLIKAA